MTETILLVHCGDRNKWIWPTWWAYFSKHWDWDCGIDVEWLSEKESPTFGKFWKYKTGVCQWSDGLIKFLQEKCTAKYIIYTCDDFMLLEPPNYKKLSELIAKMKKYDLKMIRTHCDRYVTPHIYREKKVYDDLYEVDNSGYLMTYQVPIIERDLLLLTLERHETIWDAERKGGRRIRAMKIQTHIYLDEVLYKYIEVVRQGVIKGCRGKYIETAKSGNIPIGYLPEDNEEYMRTWHGDRIK